MRLRNKDQGLYYWAGVYPFGHTAYQMLRMGVLRQAPHDKV